MAAKRTANQLLWVGSDISDPFLLCLNRLGNYAEIGNKSLILLGLAARVIFKRRMIGLIKVFRKVRSLDDMTAYPDVLTLILP